MLASASRAVRSLGLLSALRYGRVCALAATEGVFPISRLFIRHLASPEAADRLRVRRGSDDLAAFEQAFVARSLAGLVPNAGRPLVVDAAPSAGFGAAFWLTTTPCDVVAYEPDPGQFLALRKNTDWFGPRVCCERCDLPDLAELATARRITLLRVTPEPAASLTATMPDWLDRVDQLLIDSPTPESAPSLAKAGFTIERNDAVLVVRRTEPTPLRIAA